MYIHFAFDSLKDDTIAQVNSVVTYILECRNARGRSCRNCISKARSARTSANIVQLCPLFP